MSLKHLPFIEVIEPWMALARKRLERRANSTFKLLSRGARLAIERSLLQRWSALITPSLLEEMKAKKRDSFLEGKTPRDRYLDFLRKGPLNEEWFSSFLKKRPELKRRSLVYLDLWIEQNVEFLQRLEGDFSLLEKTFCEGKPLGKVLSLKQNTGDLHCGGRATCIVTFTGGKSLVYKPKDLTISEAFHSFLDQLNHVSPLPLKTYQLLVRDGYGWEEKVEHRPCPDSVAVKRYFERSGALLCLMYLLDGTDIHLENIIASGEHPILIDLETLFHLRLNPSVESPREDTVLNVGLLPSSLMPEWSLIDISGLGAKRKGTLFLSEYTNIGTDEIELKNRRSSTSQHAVTYNGLQMSAKDHVDSILSGFEQMYRVIQKEGSFLIRDFVEKTALLEVRRLIWPTFLYAKALRTLESSDAILNPQLKKKRLDWSKKALLAEKKVTHAIANAEKKALFQGDIPCFHSYPFSSDLYIKKRLVAKNCFEPSLKAVLKRLERMGEIDLEFQKTLIRYSFHTKTPLQKETKNIPRTPPDPFKLALEIGELLCRKATKKESVYWMYLKPNLERKRYEIAVTKEGFYEGKGGIALFFAALRFVSGDKKWEEMAYECLAKLRKGIEQGDLNERRLGMNGVGGMIYTLVSIGNLLNDSSLIASAAKILPFIGPKEIRNDRALDILEGSAGLILSLLALHRTLPNADALKGATQCAEHICKKAKEIERHGAIPWGKAGLEPLTGNRGIAYALLELTAVVKSKAFEKRAKGAIAFDDAQFAAKLTSSKTDSSDHFDIEWLKGDFYIPGFMQGAAGIGYTLLRMVDSKNLPTLLG